MKNIVLVFLSLVVFQSCNTECINGTGGSISKSYELDEFTEISVDGSFKVQIIQDKNVARSTVSVSAQQEIIDLMDISASGGKLTVTSKGCYTSSNPVLVLITVKELETINNNGTAEIVSANIFMSEELEINNSGTGTVSLEVQINKINIDNQGVGNVFLRGTCNKVDVQNDGAGNVELVELKTDDGDVVNNGTGSVNVNVYNNLNIELNGAGNVGYKDNPKSLNQKTNGSGKVNQLH